MRIGLDIDNTICSTNKLASVIYKKIYKKDFNELDKVNQYEFIGKNCDTIFDFCPLEDNVKEVIDKLRKDGNKIYIITARCNERVNKIEQRTINYLNKNKIYYDKIFFGKDEKYDVYKKLSLDIMLDDDYDVYDKINNIGGNCLLYNGILNSKKSGNKVYSWNEFYDYVRKEKNNG